MVCAGRRQYNSVVQLLSSPALTLHHSLPPELCLRMQSCAARKAFTSWAAVLPAACPPHQVVQARKAWLD